jgi:hypothetical protein
MHLVTEAVLLLLKEWVRVLFLNTVKWLGFDLFRPVYTLISPLSLLKWQKLRLWSCMLLIHFIDLHLLINLLLSSDHDIHWGFLQSILVIRTLIVLQIFLIHFGTTFKIDTLGLLMLFIKPLIVLSWQSALDSSTNNYKHTPSSRSIQRVLRNSWFRPLRSRS